VCICVRKHVCVRMCAYVHVLGCTRMYIPLRPSTERIGNIECNPDNMYDKRVDTTGESSAGEHTGCTSLADAGCTIVYSIVVCSLL